MSRNLYGSGLSVFYYDEDVVKQGENGIWFGTGTGMSNKYNLLMKDNGSIYIYRDSVYAVYNESGFDETAVHTIQAVYKWGKDKSQITEYLEILGSQSSGFKYNNDAETAGEDISEAGKDALHEETEKMSEEFYSRVKEDLVWEYDDENREKDLNRIWNRQKECYNRQTESFTVVSVPFEQGREIFEQSYQQYESILLRYTDDKTPIPLSTYWDGVVYGTVPAENAGRGVEVFFSEKEKFNDDNGGYEFYVMGNLSAKGIITGDENGNANPEGNITRAEAAAMVMRFIGEDKSETLQSGFTDVPQDSWCAGVIARAKKCGIIQGDSETVFSPERNVSREEIVAMTARAVWYAGLKEEKKNVSADDIDREKNVKDADKVSKWALSAYETLGYFSPSDSQQTEELDADGIPVDITLLNPSVKATRFEMAEMLMRVRDYFQVYPTQTAIKFGFDKKMPTMDGSTSTYPFTEAIYNTLFLNGANHNDKPAVHSKSHASYERLINGEVDMIIASVYPAEDILELAKEKNVELELVPIAYDAMVFFTNIDNTAEGLTSEQISDIYVDNKYDNWKETGGPDALLYPYARNYDSGSHAQMQRHFLNGGDINEKIRKETTSVTMSNILTDVEDARTDNPKGYGLGYSIYYYFNNMDMFYNTKTTLKLLSVDGVYPNDDTIADGSYPLSNNTYIVLRKDEPEGSAARKMTEFMLTEQGQQCVELAGFGPLKK